MATPFEMRWPVLDPDEPPAAFKVRALDELKVELDALGLVALTGPAFTWEICPTVVGGRGPFLVCRLEVRDALAWRPAA
jgi:hypothetical protein